MSRTTKLNRIVLEQGATKEIAKLFGCTNATVTNATRGYTDSYLIRQIRQVAIKQFGGIEVPAQQVESV